MDQAYAQFIHNYARQAFHAHASGDQKECDSLFDTMQKVLDKRNEERGKE